LIFFFNYRTENRTGLAFQKNNAGVAGSFKNELFMGLILSISTAIHQAFQKNNTAKPCFI